MFHHRPTLVPRTDRDPLRAMFLINDMTVGGAEMLLFTLIQRLHRRRIEPELGCMHQLGELGEQLTNEIPTHPHLLRHKYDFPVVWRLAKLLRRRRIDAVITVGAGDRMFWGRLAAWRARVPVVISAIHSTGWPDRVGRLNRLLTPLTDAFVGVARPHAEHLIREEGFPAERVHVIPNGVDTERFQAAVKDGTLRRMLGVPDQTPLVGIVAVLRPEKNHELFLEAAVRIGRQVAGTHFVIIGDGPRRTELEQRSKELGLVSVHFLGARRDVPQLLPQLNTFVLTSKVEANPVSILEAQSCGVPVVATRVGSIAESVLDGQTGFVVEPGDADAVANAVVRILNDSRLRDDFGRAARENVVRNWSLDQMVQGYEDLTEGIYDRKVAGANTPLAGLPAALEPVT